MKDRLVSRRRRLVDLSEAMDYLARKGFTLHGCDERTIAFKEGTDTRAYIVLEVPHAFFIPVDMEEDSGLRRLRMVPVQRPIGSCLSRLTLLFLTHEAHRRFVEPVIRDMQVEYFHELACGRIWNARWIAVCGHLRVIPGWVYGWMMRAARRIRSL